MSRTVTLPNNWIPRHYQMRAWSALESGINRVALIHPRRAGKDEVGLHWAACAAMQRPATYWHMLPKATQVRKAIWNAVNPHTGLRRIDEAFPYEIVANRNEQEMFIRFVNGSTWQCLGSDNFDSAVGSPPAGLVYSEWALCTPRSWEILSPILVENGGWAIFAYTPRGRNHGYDLYAKNLNNPKWFVERLTVEDTGHISLGDIEEERRSGKDEQYIQQEYYCSFDSPNSGAYYGKWMQQAWEQGRVCSIPIDPGADCITAWDLGMDDSTSIWIFQLVRRELRAVQYYEAQGEGLEHYTNWLKDWAEQHRVRFGAHILPHDIEVRELGTGVSRKEVAQSLGLRPITTAPRLGVDDGINAVRRLLPRMWFDQTRCATGIAALTDYSKDYDEARQVYRAKPRHDWASHGADAMRTFATGFKDQMGVAPSTLEAVNRFGGQGMIIHKPWEPQH